MWAVLPAAVQVGGRLLPLVTLIRAKKKKKRHNLKEQKVFAKKNWIKILDEIPNQW